MAAAPVVDIVGLTPDLLGEHTPYLDCSLRDLAVDSLPMTGSKSLMLRHR